MAVNDEDLTVRVDGDGSTVIVNYPYKYVLDVDLLCYVVTKSTGASALKTIAGGGVTVVASSPIGAVVTFAVAAQGPGDASPEEYFITRDTAFTQTVTIPAMGIFFEKVIMNMVDKVTLLCQQVRDSISRTVTLALTTSITSLTFSDPTDDKGLLFRDNGDGTWSIIPSTYNPDEMVSDASGFADAAEASSVTSEGFSVASSGFKDDSEAAAASSSASAAAAASSAAEGLYNTVVSKVFADSPIAPLLTEEGYLFKIDTSGGNVVVNLKELSVYAEDMKFAFVKETSDANTVTINRGGTDTINGGASVVVAEQYVTYNLVGGSTTGSWITSAQAATALQASMPIGFVYLSVVATDPATLFGFGSWSAFAAGRMLVGLDSGDTDFDTAEETGGSKTHTLVTSEMPAHTHDVLTRAFGGGVAKGVSSDSSDPAQGTGPTDVNAASTKGGDGAHNNVPPYIVVYMFKRTA